MSLRRQTFSGIRWTTTSNIGRAVLQFVQLGILARLLTPSDFGVMALVVAVIAILQIFADAGISNAIIHHQDISQSQLSSLYWLNVLVSFAIVIIVGGSAHWIALWYKQPYLQWLLILASLTLFISALAQQLRVVAQKQLKFSTLAKIDLTSALGGFVVAICAGFAGAGAFSLVLGSLTTSLTSSILAWKLLANGWRPIFQLHVREISHFLTFGAYMIGNNLANAFNSQVDVVLGGKLLGTQAIGFYSIPKELNLRVAMIINPIVTQVGMPVMAKAQNDTELLRRIYLQTMRMTASVNFPIYVFVAFFAPEIVYCILGANWQSSIALLRLLSVWALLRSTLNPVGSLLIARGRADLSFKWNIALLFITAPLAWYGSQFGVIGLTIAMTSIGVVTFLPNWYFLVKPLCGASLGEYSQQLANPLALSLITAAISYAITQFFASDLIRLILGILLGAATYWMLSSYFNRVWTSAIKELLYKK